MTEAKVSKIRDFIYLDVNRLYSLYSQVFEGVADQIVKSYIDSLTSKDAQRGLPLQGASIERQAEEVSSRTEKRILYDHMYNQLESEIHDSILEIKNIYQENYSEILSQTFLIKVSGFAEIHDYNRVRLFTEKLNYLAEAIAYAQTISEEGKLLVIQFENLIKNATDGREKAAAKENLKKLKEPKLLAKELNLAQDEKMLDYLKQFIDMFHPDGFEVTVMPNEGTENIVFRGMIDKQWLRIEPALIRSLYGVLTDSNWTMVGQVTFLPKKDSTLNQSVLVNSSLETGSQNASLRDPFRAIFDAMKVFESLFLESQQRIEVIVHPLAIYREVLISGAKIPNKLK